MTDTNKKELGNPLWGIADQLCVAMDADDFRKAIFYPTNPDWIDSVASRN